MAGIQENTGFGCGRTYRSDSWRRLTPRWCHAAPVGTRKASVMEWYSSRHLCPHTSRRHGDNGWGGSWQSGKHQGNHTRNWPTAMSSFQLLMRQRSATRGDLVISSTVTNFGTRSFAVAGRKVWNQLPSHIRAIQSVSSFKTALKTFLFSSTDSETRHAAPL